MFSVNILGERILRTIIEKEIIIECHGRSEAEEFARKLSFFARVYSMNIPVPKRIQKMSIEQRKKLGIRLRYKVIVREIVAS